MKPWQGCDSDLEQPDDIPVRPAYRRESSVLLSDNGPCGIPVREPHTEIKHQMKVDMNHQPGATHVADKSNQSCPFYHLTSNKITSINNRSYE